jgi:hypothetical protein
LECGGLAPLSFVGACPHIQSIGRLIRVSMPMQASVKQSGAFFAALQSWLCQLIKTFVAGFSDPPFCVPLFSFPG